MTEPSSVVATFATSFHWPEAATTARQKRNATRMNGNPGGLLPRRRAELKPALGAARFVIEFVDGALFLGHEGEVEIAGHGFGSGALREPLFRKLELHGPA